MAHSFYWSRRRQVIFFMSSEPLCLKSLDKNKSFEPRKVSKDFSQGPAADQDQNQKIQFSSKGKSFLDTELG